MKPGIPWSVKGIEPEVREAAKHAARRSGMTLGEWLNTVILDQADTPEQALPPAMGAKDYMTVAQPAYAPTPRSETTIRLEDIAQQLSRLAQREQETAAIRAYEHPVAPAHDEETVNRILSRIESNERQSIEAFTAVNERLTALGRQIAAAPKSAAIEKPEDVPGYPALESALRNIVDHIEISERRTRDSLKSMQDRLGDMANRAAHANSDELVRAAPAFNSLESRLSDLATRVQRNEQTASQNDELRREIGSLTHRIDGVQRHAEQLVATAHTSASQAAQRELRDIEGRIQKLLHDSQAAMATQMVNSTDVQRMKSEMSALTQRIEDVRGATASERDLNALRVAVEQMSSRMAQGPDLRPLADMDRRLVDLTQRLEQTQHSTRHNPQLGELERRIAELDHRLAEVMRMQGDGQAMAALQQHLGDVNERIGRTEQQLGHLDTIERAITQLFDGLEQHRSQTTQSLDDVAQRAAALAMPPLAQSPEIQALQQGLLAVRESADQSDRRSQETLEAVHETLEQIVTKLAELETSAAGHQVAASLAQQAAVSPAAAPVMPQADPQPAPAPQWVEPAIAARPLPDFAAPTFEAAPVFEPAAPQPSFAAPSPFEQLHPAVPPIAPAAPSFATQPVPPVFNPMAGDGLATGDDFIAAARRAAQAAAGRAAVTSPAERPPVKAGANSRFNLSLPFLKGRKPKDKEKKEPGSGGPKTVPILDAPGMKDSTRKKLILAGIVLLAAVSAFTFNMLGRSVQQAPAEAPAAIQKPAAPPAAPLAAKPQASLVLPDTLSAPADEVANLAAITDLPADAGEVTGSLPASRTDASLSSIVAEPGAVVATVEPPPAELGTESLRKAAAHGDAKAQFIVASRYLDGEGTTQNVTKAAYWYQEAASRGLPPAQYRIATLFERGRGVPKDVATALVWYERAAANGNIKSMHNAAVLAAGNELGAPDYDKAFRLFTEAAEHGLKDSQFNLAVLYERGLGSKVDNSQALFWYLVAARSNDADAQQRAGVLARAMQADEIAAIRKKADAWSPQPGNDDANVVSVTDATWQAETTASRAQPVPQPTLMTPAPAQPENSLNPIKAVQKLLMQLGFNVGDADGRMGTRTANAIRLYQLQSGLTVTGEISPDLIKTMQADAARATGA